MSELQDELIIKTADKIFEEILLFRQYGSLDQDISDETIQHKLDMQVEHFLRRDEPESAFYETLGKKKASPDFDAFNNGD
jgi:hypothetical protein